MLLSVLPVSTFTLLVFYSTFLIANVGAFLMMVISMLLANKLMYSPFTAMLEGKGLLTFLMDSTGLLSPFISKIHAPYISGRIFGRQTSGVFDRKLVYQMKQPIESKTEVILTDDGKIKFELDQKQFADSKFAMQQYPVLIWNEQLDSYITKDMLSTMEKETFAEYTILYMNRKTEELTAILRDFGRSVIELLRPKGKVGSWLIWLLIIGVIVVLGIMFAPKIMEYFGGATEAVSGAVEKTASVVSVNT